MSAERCACTECACRNQPEKGRQLCRLCRRGWHRQGPTERALFHGYGVSHRAPGYET